MATYTASCPLRVVAHIDLDAFYAQCEMRRLGVPDDQPLAVQQWYEIPPPSNPSPSMPTRSTPTQASNHD